MSKTPILIKSGTVRFVDRPDGGKNLVGASWTDGAEVILRELDKEDAAFFSDDDLKGQEGQFLQSCDAMAVDPAQENVIGYTAAPAAYDYNCTVTLETFECAVFPTDSPRTYRKVLIRGGFGGFSKDQDLRYSSGCYAFFPEDPRVTRDNYARQEAERKAEEAARETAKATDLATLQMMSTEELRDEVVRRERANLAGPYYTARHYLHQRLADEEAAERQAKLTALLAIVKNGMTIVVPETPPISSPGLPTLPGIESYVIEVRTSSYIPPKDRVEDITFECMLDNGQSKRLTLVKLAELVTGGHVRTDLPSLDARRAMKKKGLSVLTAKRFSLGDRSFYVGRPSLYGDLVVVDAETGHACRSKKAVDQLISVYNADRDAKYHTEEG